MSNKKTRGLQNTQDNRINSDLSIDPDFSSEGIISTEKKQLALAQLRIAKHQEIIKKCEAALKRKKKLKKQRRLKKKRNKKSVQLNPKTKVKKI